MQAKLLKLALKTNKTNKKRQKQKQKHRRKLLANELLAKLSQLYDILAQKWAWNNAPPMPMPIGSLLSPVESIGSRR